MTEHLVVDTAEARYSFRSAPTLLVLPGKAQSAAAIFDGTGSLGSEKEAVAWAREHFARRWGRALETLTVDETERELLGLSAQLPIAIREEELGWSFSVVVLVMRGRSVSVLALGHLSVLRLSGDGREMLHRPRFFHDEVEGAHEWPAEELARFEHLVVSPFLGGEKVTSLPRIEVSLAAGDTVVASHSRLVDAVTGPPESATSVQAGPARSYGPSAAIVIRGR